MQPLSVERRPAPRRGARTKRLTAAAAVLALSAVGLAAAPVAQAAPVTGTQAVGYVNTFIGSKDDGNTFPGATVPFGMIQLSPDTGHNVGYNYDNNAVRGFSQVHLSGVGCGLGGFAPITPATDMPTSTDYGDGGYSRSIVKDNGNKVESAAPGYYTVDLESGAGNIIKAELTASERTGMQRYTFNTNGTTPSFIRVNAGQALSWVRDSSVNIDSDNRIVRTRTKVYRFCQDTPDFEVWTTTKFNTPFTSFGTWVGNTVTAGQANASSTQRTGATLEFPHNATVEFQTATSYVSAAGADANLLADSAITSLSDNTTALNFDGVHSAATAAWAAQLGKVQVTQGASNYLPGQGETQLRTFYSALYRSFVAPNLGSDVTGDYRGWDGDIHNIAEAGISEYYQNFSLWDTYRTQQQWLYLTEPTRSIDMVKSIVLQAEQSDWLPRWGYGPVETNVMTGDPGTPFLVSAYDQGLLTDGWAERAYAVLKHNADNQPLVSEYPNGRADNNRYLERGFVTQNKAAKFRDTDFDMDHGGSATLEYALADGTLAYMAQGLGHTEDAERYALRGQNFRTQWNGTGFLARDANGAWVDPNSDEGKSAYHEGTSPQYEWLVQHDFPSLIELMGGKEATNARLDTFFAYNSIDLANNPGQVAHNSGSNHDWWVTGTYDYYGTKTYNPNNEPDLHAPYVYLWTGQPWKTTDVVREGLELFTDSPNGVTGNDDLGTMAAWQVQSTIGIYPIQPGRNIWGLTTPVFDKVEIALEPTFFGTDKLTVEAPGASMTNRYTQSVTAGSTNVTKAYLTGEELVNAGTLKFTAGASPSDWATADSASPGALATVSTLPTRLIAQVTGNRIVVPAGGSTTATVSYQVTGKTALNGPIQATAEDGINVTGAGSLSANPAGGTVLSNGTVNVAVDAGVAPGDHTVKLTIGAVTTTLTVNVTGVSPLRNAGAFNNKAFGQSATENVDDTNVTTPAKFNVGQSTTEFYLRSQAAASGNPLGAFLTHPTDPSMTYILHDSGAGSAANAYDNISTVGQTTNVTGLFPNATKVAFVVSSNNGNENNKTATLNFANSTTKSITLTATDWCSQYRSGDNLGLGRGTKRFSDKVQNSKCGLWVTEPVSLEGQELTSIQWPNAEKLHVFAIASDAHIAASANPSVPATGEVGSELTGTVPTFSGASDEVISEQWLRNGEPIPGATSANYTPTAEDAGTELTFQVTAYVPGLAPTVVTSNPVAIPGLPTVTVVTNPAITGTAKVGSTLTASAAVFAPADATVSYQWQADGNDIAGATGTTLTLTATEVGKSISVTATAAKSGYNGAVATSAAVGPVLPADVVPGDDSISILTQAQLSGTARVGVQVQVVAGKYSPAATEAYQWLVAGQPVAGATASTFTPAAAQAGKALSVTVTATAPGRTAVTATLAAGTIARGVIKTGKKPVIKKGKKKVKKKTKINVGNKVKSTKGKATATGAKVRVSYRWFIGNKKVKGKKGAKKAFKVTRKALAKKLSVRVTYKAPGYTKTTVKSAKTPKVRR